MNRAAHTETNAGSSRGSLPSSDPRRVMHDMRDAVSDMAEEATDRALSLGGEVKTMATKHPYATIAVAAGLAFTIGALWQIGQTQRRSRLERMWDNLPNRDDLYRYWR